MMLVPACRRLDSGDTVGTAAPISAEEDCDDAGGDAKFRCGTAWRNPSAFSLPAVADTIGENDEDDAEDSGAAEPADA